MLLKLEISNLEFKYLMKKKQYVELILLILFDLAINSLVGMIVMVIK